MSQKIKSVGQYIQRIEEICKDSQNNKYYYRGEARKFQSIKAQLFRDGDKPIQNYRKMKKEFFRYATSNNFLKDENNLLVFCQQYNIPTNLVNITSNALEALFFACDDEIKNDGYVYLFTCGLFSDITSFITKETNSLVVSSDFEIMFSENEGSLFDFDFVPKFEWNLKVLESIYDSSDGLTPQMHYESIDDYIELLIPESTAKCKNLVEQEFFMQLPPLLYNPDAELPRGMSSNFMFVFQDYIYQPECGIMKHQELHPNSDIVIESSSKKQILEQLDSYGINRSSIFGDIRNVAQHIADKFTN